MTYRSPYRTFIFEAMTFDDTSCIATFLYSFDGQRYFTERAQFASRDVQDNKEEFDRALFLIFILAGISYYKAFPTTRMLIKDHPLTPKQASFFSEVYRDGLSQFVYESKLSPEDIAVFEPTVDHEITAPQSSLGDVVLLPQSGGKDSLLLAVLMEEKEREFTPWYVSQSSGEYPRVLDTFTSPLRVLRRTIDRLALSKASAEGGLNGHVPITYITMGYACVDAMLIGASKILPAIGREGEEPYIMMGNYAVRHQWSKTWRAERLFQSYISACVSSKLLVGSPLRGYSELKIAELFVRHAWKKYAHSFSSCNVANYKQLHRNAELKWCGVCAKCANSYLLFAPFVQQSELDTIIGEDLFQAPILQQTFMGLLGVNDIEKPFECVGETDELRLAYKMARKNGYPPLSFAVPDSDYDYEARSDAHIDVTDIV